MTPNSQQSAWEAEYQDPAFISLHDEPQEEIRRLVKWLKKEGTAHFGYNILQDPDQPRPVVLDLGCGNGRNLNFLAREYGARGWGYDFAPTAIARARQEAGALPAEYEVRSIGEEFLLDDASTDIVLDITASHALYEGERDIYLREVARVLKPGGIFVVRTLCLDGDKNAKYLLKTYPGPEPDTYILAEQNMMEKVFSEETFRARYGEYFDIIELAKPSGYQRWGNQSFKRRYLVSYLVLKR